MNEKARERVNKNLTEKKSKHTHTHIQTHKLYNQNHIQCMAWHGIEPKEHQRQLI